ncbi:hypothetical protein C8R47DRAFT_668701 [Mycena vitilis]|nr:hypothetical protein C8R47DRAFT_668701 [Mycena vitilis]
MVDLPRKHIPTVTASALLQHWGNRVEWAKTEGMRRLTSSICDKELKRLVGASHCEAGLMASLLIRIRPTYDALVEPPVLSGGFSRMTLDRLPIGPIPIGGAKKCCPVCRMLAELLLEQGVDIELPGQHNHYHPWVAPHWLPADVLEALETRLLSAVAIMFRGGDNLINSAASSPISDLAMDDALVSSDAAENWIDNESRRRVART